jgi:hypothetical protein
VLQAIKTIQYVSAIQRCCSWLTGLASIVFACSLLAVQPALADTKPPKDWGLAIGVRTASIPFKAEVDHVNDILPLMYYHGERFNLHGLSSWYVLLPKKHWEINALARFRF